MMLRMKMFTFKKKFRKIQARGAGSLARIGRTASMAPVWALDSRIRR
jgi:hypothetical protein